MRRDVLMKLLIAYVGALLLVVFLPIGGFISRSVVWLHQLGERFGMPQFLAPGWYEFGLNVLLFTVPASLAVLLWPRVRRWVWIAVAFIASTAIELIQFAVLPRVADLTDVIANVTGAVVGIAAVTILSRPPAIARPGGRTIVLHDVPEDLLKELETQASRVGRSLPAHLHAELSRIAHGGQSDADVSP